MTNPAHHDARGEARRDPHPDFDGHLARPVPEMTDGERLRLAWEGTLLLHWARRARITLAPARDEGDDKTRR